MKMRFNKTVLSSLLAVVIALMAFISIPVKPALAQSITLSKTYGYVGTQVTVTGTNFMDYTYEDVSIYFGDIYIRTLEVSPTGTFTTSFNIPNYVEPGRTYTITVKNVFNATIASKTFAVVRAILEVEPVTGKIDDWVKIKGSRLDASREICIYFSSDKAIPGQKIDTAVTAYEDSYQALYGRLFTDSDGKISPNLNYKIPSSLTHGSDKEDVHDGTYYFYITYRTYKGSELTIEALAEFTILGGIIKLEPETAQVGSEVFITGEDLRNDQNITITYDGKIIPVASGDTRTDSEGNFNSTFVVPEGIVGEHNIVVRDESGNTPKAKFYLKPKLTVEPDVEVAGELVSLKGYGFAAREYITVYMDDKEVPTVPTFIQTNSLGSFIANLKVPDNIYPGSRILTAKDAKLNTTETKFIILSSPTTDPTTGISLTPGTSSTSPGHVGMELIVEGAKFHAGTDVSITFSNGKTIKVADAETDNTGKFFIGFVVPSVPAGRYTVTASDGSNNMTALFFMESSAPVIPVPLIPKMTDTAEPEAFFNWEGIDDPSGVTYILQIGSDAGFENIILEKKDLPNSEYRLTKDEKLESTGNGKAYYWRIKAVDGAFNESDWTPAGLFYINKSSNGGSSWIQYILYGIGVLVLVFLGFWIRKQIISRKTAV